MEEIEPVTTEDGNLGGVFVDARMDRIRPNPWNPNQMKDKEFDRLVREIEDSGMINPIQVVEMDGDDGTYMRILGGEHRYHACKVLGYETIPAIVLTDEKWKDEDRQKFVTMRLNVIKGNLNGEKLMAMVDDLSETYEADAMADLMGYTDKDAWDKLVSQTKASVKESGLPKKAIDEIENELDKLDDEIKTVDSLQAIVHKVMLKYGGTVDKHFIFFDHGGRQHVMLAVKEETWELAKMVTSLIEGGVETVDSSFAEALKSVITKHQ